MKLIGMLEKRDHRGDVGFLAVLLVADQAGRKLQARRVERGAMLLDEQHVAVDEREDHRGADAAGPRYIFPFPLALGGDVLALPNDLFGLGHSSTRRSGS